MISKIQVHGFFNDKRTINAESSKIWNVMHSAKGHILDELRINAVIESEQDGKDLIDLIQSSLYCFKRPPVTPKRNSQDANLIDEFADLCRHRRKLSASPDNCSFVFNVSENEFFQLMKFYATSHVFLLQRKINGTDAPSSFDELLFNIDGMKIKFVRDVPDQS